MRSHFTSLVRAAGAFAVAATFLASSVAVRAQNFPIFTLTETGMGDFDFEGTFVPIPIPGMLAPDPGPGGRSAALTYKLGVTTLVAGDLIILDAGGIISDVIRFNPAGTSPGYAASAIFYSLAGEGQLADTGFPAAFYSKTVTLFEDAAGRVLYTPGVNDPGYLGSFPVRYEIISTPAAVAENG